MNISASLEDTFDAIWQIPWACTSFPRCHLGAPKANSRLHGRAWVNRSAMRECFRMRVALASPCLLSAVVR